MHLAETSNVLLGGGVFICMYVCVCLHVSMCTCKQVPKEVSRGCGSSGAIATGCCESSKVDART